MATLNVSTATTLDNAIPEYWEVKIRKDAARKAFWSKFEGGEGSSMPIVRKDDFQKKPGDTLHIQTLSQLGGDGVTGENTLAGNEEQLSLGQFDLTVDWLRHAVAFTEKATKQANFDAIMAANELLSSWMARRLDSDLFTRIITTDSPDAMYCNDATTAATLGVNDTFGTTELDRIRLALIRKGAIPIRTIRKGSEEIPVYAVVISEVDEYNLSADTVWVQAQRDAKARGEDNPLFTAALGMYHSMIVYVHYGLSGYQGTPLRPEAAIYGAHANDVTTITVGANTNKNYTKFFDSAGTIAIVNSSGEKEFVTYTGKTNNTFTGCTRGASYQAATESGGADADGASVYTGGELVTAYNHKSIVVGFGAEIAARGWGQHPVPIHQEEDYGFEKGIGIKAVFGQKAIEDSAGDKPNYLIMHSYSGNPSADI